MAAEQAEFTSSGQGDFNLFERKAGAHGEVGVCDSFGQSEAVYETLESEIGGGHAAAFEIEAVVAGCFEITFRVRHALIAPNFAVFCPFPVGAGAPNTALVRAMAALRMKPEAL